MNTHSPFEPGYIGNSDGAVALLEPPTTEFPETALREAGASDEELVYIREAFDELDGDQQEALLEYLDSQDGADAFLAEARDAYDKQVTFDALREEDQSALAALSPEEQTALAALTDDERAALTPAEPTAVDQGGTTTPPTGTVDDVLAWVGNDRGRAETALAIEETRDKPRAGIIGPLTQMLTGKPAVVGEQGPEVVQLPQPPTE